MDRRISVRGIALHEGKLLCVKLKQYEGADMKSTGYWCLPGGKLEAGEGLVDGVSREMVEETGVQPDVGSLLYVQQFEYEGRDYLEFFFHIRNGADYVGIDLGKSSHGPIEIAEIGYIDPHSSEVLPRFLGTDDLAAQAAGTSAPKIFSYIERIPG